MRAVASLARALALTAALAVVPAPAAADPDGFNRAMLRFNRWVLAHVLEPAACGWNVVVPKFFQRRVVDFLGNLEGPRDVVNSLLQGKPRRAGIHAGRFVLNTTAGIGGFYDVSTRNLRFIAPPESFDETFGVWGLPPGGYLVLPVLGEFSVRSLAGWVGDVLVNPIGYVPGAPLLVPTAAAYALRDVNLLAQRMPSPRAPRGAWDAYERARFDLAPYEVGRRLFYQDQADRVAE